MPNDDTLSVLTVAGSVLPLERGRGYVGYTQCAADDPDADVVIEGVCGLKRTLTAVDVPNTLYYRRALGCGDLLAAPPPEPEPPPELEPEPEPEPELLTAESEV